VKVVGDYTCIVIRKDLPDSLVYELNKAVWEHKAELVAAVKDMGELEPSIAIPATVPAHEGSIKFWSEVK
ncbi:MAG: C4-dicarboxylate ABC transporter substrate-binding protein, partial [Synergistaceae bacterium]|nr:C4-dicarboxylate ABC transporter substrate-binding protein [Synergistaceae bacterium]